MDGATTHFGNLPRTREPDFDQTGLDGALDNATGYATDYATVYAPDDAPEFTLGHAFDHATIATRSTAPTHVPV